MDFRVSAFPIILSFFIIIFTILKLGHKSNAKGPSKLPPGPRKLPIIGNLHQLLGSPPPRALHNLAKKYGPLMHLQLGEVPHVVVSSAKVAKEVMKTHDLTFATRPRLLAADVISYGSVDIAFAPYGEYWRQLRKICTLELLSTKRVQSFRHVREEEVSNLVKWVASSAGSPINLTTRLFSSNYGVTSIAAFGKKCKEQEEFISVVTESIKFAAGFEVGDVFPSSKWLHVISGMRPRLEKLHQRADRIMNNIIREKREARAKRSGDETTHDDLLDILLRYADHCGPEFSLTTDNIKAVILDIFAAGSETSATQVDWAFVEMMRNPRILKKAQAEVREVFDRRGKADETGLPELEYLKFVIKESLRMHPSVPLLLPRECGESCEISSYEIPVKTKVLVNAWAIGRDPEYWDDPETFYPERFKDNPVDYKGTSFEYIPFGAGRRICPGMNFGLANVELPLAMLLYHFDWELPEGMKSEEMDMSEALGVTQRRKHDLYLVPKPYQPAFTSRDLLK
ncbi:cytochrome P450 71D11-like [Rhodamnia argentea]|uniref:Cytochrome P450 71D11-like n=1 Tax=Rhodamnia argentea TaxID=178133 RepID=A0A8B8N9H2_9MYRT|nr:cytochrome P450 71D11-like [Rhodamnia argentea]